MRRKRQEGPSTKWPSAKLRLGTATELRERPRNNLAEEREVAVRLGVRSLVDSDLGRDELARLQVEGVREGDDASVTEQDGPLCRLDLFREAYERSEEGKGARLLVYDAGVREYAPEPE